MMYRCILADAPWAERGGGKYKRGADRHYKVMGKRRILEAILDNPELDWEDDAHLWLWSTNNKLCDALWIMEEMDFDYKTCFTWVKAEEVSTDFLDYPPDHPWWQLQNPGLGQYSRGLTEQLLFGTRGEPMFPDTKHRPPTVLMAPRREHSRKPEEAYELIEKVSPGPRIELFARHRREGWDAWGLEVGDG